jgi:FkbM family methyltransferase
MMTKNETPFAAFYPGAVHAPQGFYTMWIGSLVRRELVSDPPSAMTMTPTPPINEEFFEWQSLIDAAIAASGQFCFVELGAGFGRWSAAAAIAARRRGIPIRLICVEAEPNKCVMLRQHLRDNGIDPTDHRIVEAAVSSKDGPVFFTIGRAVDWRGQAILPSIDYGYGDWDGVHVETVDGVSLATILTCTGIIDLIDMDIQGAEADVIESSPALLNDQVKRVHISTHNADVEARIRAALGALEWRQVWDFPCGEVRETPVGKVDFQDGVQAWVNPRHEGEAGGGGKAMIGLRNRS